jgi:hypothetical protein
MSSPYVTCKGLKMILRGFKGFEDYTEMIEVGKRK